MTPHLDALETLKAWVHWKRKETAPDEHDLAFAKAVEDLVSQVGTFRAERDRLKAYLDSNNRDYFALSQRRAELQAKGHEYRKTISLQAAKISKLDAELDAACATLNWIANNASSWGLEAEAYVTRCKDTLDRIKRGGV